MLDAGKKLGTYHQRAMRHRVVKTGNRPFEKTEQRKYFVTTLKNENYIINLRGDSIPRIHMLPFSVGPSVFPFAAYEYKECSLFVALFSCQIQRKEHKLSLRTES
jgi:hypothetical protein